MATGSVPYFAYGAVNLTGNTRASLDGIPGKDLHHNDIAIALSDNKIYFFKLDKESGEEEDVPYVIKPHDEEGDKRWILISQETYTTDIVQLAENYIQTGHIKALTGSTIQIESSQGESIYINQDGTVEFPSHVRSDTAPDDDSDFTNKLYVDDEYDSKQSELETYVDDEVSSIESDLETYTDDEFNSKQSELETYIDSEYDSKKTEIETYIDDRIDYIDGEKQDTTDYFDSTINDKENTVYSYVDTETEETENEIKQYTNDEIDNASEDWFIVKRFTINESDWTQDDDLYYYDITHNKGHESLVIRCWNSDNEYILPTNIYAIDKDTTRIWMSTNEQIIVNII